MSIKTLLITPPFTQLNTPYPATAYLKGFLANKNLDVNQCDLSIELFTSIFTSDFLKRVFQEAKELESFEFSLVWQLQEKYILIVEKVIKYLQFQDISTANEFLEPNFFPQGHRIQTINQDIKWANNEIGKMDKAKHFATLFIEELGDFIHANVDEFFSFTRYAEQIATSASSFDKLEEYLNYQPTLIEDKLLDLLEKKIEFHSPDLVCFTIPFPGNLFAALRCSQYLKQVFPEIKIAIGGGYCNTELRSLKDPRIFEYIDFITLDNGEIPVFNLINYLDNNLNETELERTFLVENEKVVYKNKFPNTPFFHKKSPAPSYKDLPLEKYLSFLDVNNPMHRLWTDGRWNKLTVSYGCYWKQCTFCDVNLDYISNYQNTSAEDLVNKIEAIMAETGFTGFHFVDEAAPPKVLKSLAKLLIDKQIKIFWWTNIRFEKTFDSELCSLLAKSGCIAVTGGLEVASDRLLKKMKKGVDIAQVARVTNNFAKHNIMVHAYLMYGFPTQTTQETIDSLEIVRQLFQNNCIQSAYWHQFTTTVHSPIGKNPKEYDIEIIGPVFEGFAQNDLYHLDPKGTEHPKFTTGLNLALNNYLNGIGFDLNLKNWFDFEIPKTTLDKNYIENSLIF